MMSELSQRLADALVGRYRIERKLGAGGMARVYLARDVKHERRVAVKVLRPELAASVGERRFLREIEIAAKLSHPHILTLIDSGAADGLLYYVMPYVGGGSLRDRLKAERTLSVEEVLGIARQVCSALQHAHERGIVHRDIKPENILLNEGHAVVADFGVARAVREAGGDRLTRTGVAVGTLTYMSPEQALGESGIDGRTDLYALAAVVYETLAGFPPFEAATPQALLARRILGRPRGLRSVDPDIPLFVERAVERALAGRAEDRFSTVTEFAETLSSRSVGERIGRGRVAVLPPVNVTGDPSEEHLVQGLHEALISELGQRDLAVLARASVLRYRGSDRGIREIAGELDVDAVVEASLHRVGGSLSVGARLVDADREEVLWSGSFEGPASDVFHLYRKLGDAIATAAEPALAAEAAPVSRDRRTVSPEAYEKYMRGRVHQERFTPEDLGHALRYYEAVLEADPEYAPAYAGMALVLGSQIVLGVGSALELGPRWRESALRAVQLDPELAEGHSALAQARTWFDWSWPAAEASFRRSLELDPNDPQTRTFYSHFLAMMGRHSEALAQGRRAIDLDSNNPFHQTMHAVIHLSARRFEDTLREVDKAIDMAPGNPLAHHVRLLAEFNRGDPDAALASALRYYTILGDETAVRALREGSEEGGFAVGARRLGELLAARRRETFVKPEMLSFAFDWAGDIEAAMEWVQVGYEERDHQIAYAAVSPYSAALHSDPRYQRLLRELNLPTDLVS